jgi:branched-chain amino acid transport system substrate-binding protein
MCSAGVALVSPSCTAPELTGSGRPAESFCFLRTAHNDVVQASAAARFAWEVLKAKKAATIHDESLYSNTLQQMFAGQFQKMGGAITSQEAVASTGENVQPAVDRIIAGTPDVVYYPLFVEAAAAVTRRMRESGAAQAVQLMSADASFSPDLLGAAGPSSLSLFFSSPDLGRFSPAYQEFRKRYVDTYGLEPVGPFHAHAYDAAAMILAAVEGVAVQDPDGTLHIPRRALIEALYATRGFSGLTGTLSCSPTGDCADPKIAVYEVVNADPASWNPGADQDSNPKKIWP